MDNFIGNMAFQAASDAGHTELWVEPSEGLNGFGLNALGKFATLIMIWNHTSAHELGSVYVLEERLNASG